MRRQTSSRPPIIKWLPWSIAAILAACGLSTRGLVQAPDPALAGPEADLVAEGQQIFRYETFGDEQQWTDTLRLHEVVDQKLQPLEALRLGLKVDVDKLHLGRFLLHNPFGASGTRELLREDAVVGVRAQFGPDGHITKLGITCALCHSTVDNSFVHGIGHRLDGWPNRDLDVGAIIAMAPGIPEDKKAVYRSWGKGKYDPRFNFDGKSTPLVLPPAYGLANVRNETYTADAPISYWNNYVAVTQMGGMGNFSEPRLGIEVHREPDLVTARLPALRAYQHSLAAPRSMALDAAGQRGKTVFDSQCSGCHVGGNGTDNNAGVLHDPAETGMDGAYAERTVNKRYRTTPLRGLRFHPPYFHDGSAATLADVVAHYNRRRSLNLTDVQQRDLVRYLESL
ncbi:MAG: c-type cytochrome [Lysobacter sp.]|nr:c-type cytochrome [Lysobacter sp.]